MALEESQNDPALREKMVASPAATGGAGPDFERDVGAYYLATTLLEVLPRGVNAGSARRVRFQRLFEGEPLDDIIVDYELPAGTAKLALQVKRDLTFGEADKTFDEVMGACWRTFRSPQFDRDLDRFGVALAFYSKTVDEHYQSVLTWARNSAYAGEFLNRISTKRLASQTQRSFLELIRGKLDRHNGSPVGDEDMWRFLRAMVLLRFDSSSDGSGDHAHAVQMLATLLPSSRRAEAPMMFRALVSFAAEGFRTAGSFDAALLRSRLLAEGFDLLPAVDCRRDLEILDEHARLILGHIRTDIAGLTLSRPQLVAEAQAALHEASFIEIVGPPGSGKSAILKALAEIRRNQGSTLVLSHDRLAGNGWSGFARALGLDRRLDELLLASGGSAEPCVFIDNADRITDRGERLVVKDLLLALDELRTDARGTARRWKVILTAREENLEELHSWLDPLAFGQPRILRVPELSPDEVRLVAELRPHLLPLLGVERLDPIIRNPFMLSLLADRRMFATVTPADRPPPATETEVQSVWWERVVGTDDGDLGVLGRARQMTLLRLGAQAERLPGRPLIVDAADAAVIKSLERERILLRDVTRDVYRFGHDLLEDWVLCRVLNQKREELPTQLRLIDQPFGLLRAVQLMGCALLEQEPADDSWEKQLVRIEAADGLSPRWRQAFYTAPLLSTRAAELLDDLTSFLLADDGRRLIDLLTILRTIEVDPDYALLAPLGGIANRRDFIAPVLLGTPLPRLRSWTPVMGWLTRHADELPQAARFEAARAIQIWMKQTPRDAPHREALSGIVFAWLSEIERWYDRGVA